MMIAAASTYSSVFGKSRKKLQLGCIKAAKARVMTRSVSDVAELRPRFRSVSAQLQDSERSQVNKRIIINQLSSTPSQL
ncbi:hypothetical protein ACFX13_043796 [Malus domestica]